MLNPSFKSKLKDKGEIFKFLEEMEFRIPAFLKEYIGLMAEEYKNQIAGRYGSTRDETAAQIAENIEAYYLDGDIEDKKDVGGERLETKIESVYSSAVAVSAIKKKASDVDKSSNVIKVKQNKRSIKQVPPEVFVLIRYGPWHMDELPFIPETRYAIVTFVEEDPKKVSRVKKINKRDRVRVRKELSKYGVKYTSRKEIIEELQGYDDMEYWILRKEFGLDGRKMEVWKPALKYLMTKGAENVLKKNVDLIKTMNDPNYKGYKNLGKRYKILPKDIAKSFEKFSKRIGG